MSQGHRISLGTVLGVLGVASTVILALILRLQDPLSTSVIPAEDPYRHMAFTREFMRSGSVGPVDTLGSYPPGLHVLIGAIWAWTGADLYAIYRFAPVLFGTIGVIGMGALLWRHCGPTAAFVASLAYAVAPGIVHFTSSMTPTAVDLAVTPFLFYALLEIVRGRLRWIPAAALLMLLLVFVHPWFLVLLLVPIALFTIACALILILTGTRDLSFTGLAGAVAVTGGAYGVSLMDLGGLSTRTSAFILPPLLLESWVPYVVITAAVAPLAACVAFPRIADRSSWPMANRPVPFWSRIVVALIIATSTLLVTALALEPGMPQWVDLPRDFGWPLLMLAAAGLLLLPFSRERLVLLAAAYSATAYPLSIHGLFGPDWLPYRTSIFLGIGLMILAGTAVRVIARGITDTVSILHTKGLATYHVRWTAAVLPTVLIVAPLGGVLYAATPENHPWYRLYGECEVDAIEDVAATMNQDPKALVLTGSWQSWIVLVAFIEDPNRSWIGHWWMRDYQWHHQDTLELQERKGSPLYLLVDPYTHDEVSEGDLDFLEDDLWQVHGEWCPDGDESRITLYSSGELSGSR